MQTKQKTFFAFQVLDKGTIRIEILLYLWVVKSGFQITIRQN